MSSAANPGAVQKLARASPRSGPVAGLLLELAAGGERPVLDVAGRRIDVERAGRDLEEDAPAGSAELADEQHAGRLGRGRGSRPRRMADDVALGARAVGPLDRVDAERQVVAVVEDPRLDEGLGQVSVGDSGSAPGPVAQPAGPSGPGHGRAGRLRRPRCALGASVSRLRVEQVDLLERHAELEDVAAADPVLGVDDRDDVLLGRA